MSEQIGSTEAGKTHKALSGHPETARLYLTLAKLVEYNNRILSKMDAAKIEKGLSGESLDDLKEAMNGFALLVAQLWRPLIDDFSKWEQRGTPEEVFAAGVVKRYTAGMLGMLEEGREGSMEEKQDRVLEFLFGQEWPRNVRR